MRAAIDTRELLKVFVGIPCVARRIRKASTIENHLYMPVSQVRVQGYPMNGPVKPRKRRWYTLLGGLSEPSARVYRATEGLESGYPHSTIFTPASLHLPREWTRMIQKCVTVDPSERPPSNDLIELFEHQSEPIAWRVKRWGTYTESYVRGSVGGLTWSMMLGMKGVVGLQGGRSMVISVQWSYKLFRSRAISHVLPHHVAESAPGCHLNSLF